MTNQTTPAVFNFNNSTQIRTYIDDNQNPWFLAKDVCDILGYANPHRTLSLHCKEGGVTKRYTPTSSGEQEMTYINEGNLYRLIVKSKKPEAEKFEMWVMEEVLPTIRKTGEYRKPEGSVEKLTNKDMENLSYLVKVMSSGFRFKDCASAGIWHALRAVTQTPSPNRFTVEDLPVLAEECKRIMAITSAFHKSVFSAEKEIVRKVMRGNKDAEAILLEIDNEFESIVQSRELDFSAIGKFENNLLASLSVKN